MPRKGPPKTTSRDEKNNERKDATRLRKLEEQKEEKVSKAVRSFDSRSINEMPENKSERRILRLALEKSGRVMERYGAGPHTGPIMEKSSEYCGISGDVRPA
mmetsp:Transcript_18827/g.18145  ORF Transcript_18827/g.18145 Transcript_18827/m.18145 type:complete len:102 (+) Transcript_18827:108-413(+)